MSVLATVFLYSLNYRGGAVVLCHSSVEWHGLQESTEPSQYRLWLTHGRRQ